MMRRAMLTGVAVLALGACAAVEPADFSYGGRGFQLDNTRLNLAYAERNFGDMSRYRGKPAETAAAIAQFEAVVAGLQNPGNNITMTEVEGEMIRNAIRRERAALGIPLPTQPRDVAAALAAAVPPLASGDQGGIRTALSNPVFTLGPDATLARLTNLPPMPEMESVAPWLTTSAASEAGSAGNLGIGRR